MGYNTDFEGQLTIDKKLSLDDYQWLIRWNDERHEEGEGFPSYYCQWRPTEDGQFLEWDGSEKFYNYIEWLKYLIEKFFQPRGYVLNGQIVWNGEDKNDIGKVIVENNNVLVKEGKIVFK